MGGGGGLALNQLLVVMDGIDNPPFTKRVLDEPAQHLPRRARTSSRGGSARSRSGCRRRGPRGEQIYFIGATNVPLDRLDPALIRPGRMGRHVWFRTPTKQDRLDVFDLYITKVAHDAELDTPKRARRDRADHERLLAGDDRPGLLDGADARAPRRPRPLRAGSDLVEAMTTIESGTAIGDRVHRRRRRARSRSTRPATPPPGTSS